MDKIYYINLIKFACKEMEDSETNCKKIYDDTMNMFNYFESISKLNGEIIKDKDYYVRAYNFLLERYVKEVLKPDSEPEAIKEDLKERIENKFDKIYLGEEKTK